MNLPACHSRRELPGETRVFLCAHPRVHATGNRVTASLCQVCNYWQMPAPPVFRDVQATAAAPPRPRGNCVSLGEEIGLRDCKSCRGTVRLKVFACHHPQHEETTMRECERCTDYQPRREPQ